MIKNIYNKAVIKLIIERYYMNKSQLLDVKQQPIQNMLIIGDSFTDIGQMYQRYLFNVIPMRWLAGLTLGTKKQRFCDNRNWLDYFLEKFNTKLPTPGITGQQHNTLVRIYAEGGLYDTYNPNKNKKNQGYNFRNFLVKIMVLLKKIFQFIASVRFIVTKKILTSLHTIVNEIKNYDNINKLSLLEKQNTLVLVWTGANDMLTINDEPTDLVIRNAINSKQHELERLIKLGYKNFYLFSVADPSETPKCSKLSREKKTFINEQIIKYNKLLREIPHKIKYKNKDKQLNFQFFDVKHCVEKIFIDWDRKNIESKCHEDIMQKCLKNHLGKKTESKCSKKHKYWDEVHPVSKVHKKLSTILYKDFNKKFSLNWSTPPDIFSRKPNPV